MYKLFLRLLFCCVLCVSRTAQANLQLVQKHHSEAVIYLPEKSGEAVKMAAKELQVYLQKISNAKLPIVTEQPKGGVCIVLQILPDDPDDLFVHDTFSIEVSEQTITIAGHSEVAVLYGAYQFLNDLGVYWFSPGVLGENVPQKADIFLALDKKTERPTFRSRVIDYNGTDDWHFSKKNAAQQHRDFDLWLLRNKLQFSRLIHNRSPYHSYDFGWVREYSYHNLRNSALGRDWQKNDKLDPERLALVTKGGVAERRLDKAQICFTNPENIKTAIQSAVTFFEEYPDRVTFPLSPDDHSGFCECERCTAANGGISPATNPNQVVWKFMNAVAKGLHEKLPGKRIAFYATYQSMTRPPYGIQAEPNLVALTCHVQSQARPIDDPSEPRNVDYLDSIRLVETTGAEMGSYDYFLFPGNPQPLTILDSVGVYHSLGYIWYSTEWMGRDEQRYIVGWILAQLAWNAEQDPQALLKTFCEKYYGVASVPVIEWLELIEARTRMMKRITHGHISVSALMLTDSLIEEGRALLEKAQSEVGGREAERVRRLSLTFESWVRATKVDRLYRELLRTRSEEVKQEALEEVKAFEIFWEENALSEICSPRLKNYFIPEYQEKIEKVLPKVVATGREDLLGATRGKVMEAMFTDASADIPTLLRESAVNGFPQIDDNVVPLAEVWKFQIDPQDDATAKEKNSEWSKPEFDDSKWFELSTYNFFDAQGFADYKGVFWYRLKFRAPNFPKGKRVWLRIGSLDDDGTIYLNGKVVWERENIHPNDWKTSFAYDVTDTLKQGSENVIAIRGFNNFGVGGLWRPVGLYTRENLRL